MKTLVRLALHVVPGAWRASIAHDLEDEAREGRRPTWWRLWQTLRVGVHLRLTMGRESMRSDVRYALRSLLRARWFSLGAIGTFAIGIGVNVAVFTTIDRMLFKPLPYERADELFVMGEYGVGQTRPAGTLAHVYVNEARRQLQSFAGLSVTSQPAGYAITPDTPTVLALTKVSANTLSVLGVRPVMGRDFSDADERERRSVVLMNFEAWQSRLGGAPDVVGRRLWSGGRTAEVIGVLPRGFIPPPTLFDPRSDGLSLDLDPFVASTPQSRATPPTVRLKPGVTQETAEAELTALVARLRTDGLAEARNPTQIRLMPIRMALFGRYQTYLWLVFSAASVVLLMCCGNLASLLLVRGRSREHVAAMQIALGATRARVLTAALLESAFLAISGSVVALVVVAWTSGALRAWLPPLLSRYMEGTADWRVLAFSLGAAALCAILAGVLPSLRAARVQVLSVIQEASRTRTSRLRGGASLLVVEAALGVLLVGAAAATARSLIGLTTTDVGVDRRGLQLVNITLPSVQGQDPGTRMRSYLAALEVLRNTDGVRLAGGADVVPIVGAAGNGFGPGYRGQRWQVTDGFFETMGMRVLAGRPISRADLDGSADVAVLSERGLQMVWPSVTAADAIGRVLAFDGQPARQVIGIVGDVRGSFAAAPEPSIYLPLRTEGFRFLMYVARTAEDALIPIPELQARLTREVAAPRAVTASPFAARLSSGLADQRFRTTLFGAFGVLALLLAAIGLYAVASFEVAQRAREMGVRLALGAAPSRLQRRLLGDAIKPVIAGVVIGVIAAWWAGRFLQSFLHQVDARDPWTLAGVCVVLLATAVVAVWVPTRRAARIDPAIVLRSQ